MTKFFSKGKHFLKITFPFVENCFENVHYRILLLLKNKPREVNYSRANNLLSKGLSLSPVIRKTCKW